MRKKFNEYNEGSPQLNKTKSQNNTVNHEKFYYHKIIYKLQGNLQINKKHLHHDLNC